MLPVGNSADHLPADGPPQSECLPEPPSGPHYPVICEQCCCAYDRTGLAEEGLGWFCGACLCGDGERLPSDEISPPTGGVRVGPEASAPPPSGLTPIPRAARGASSQEEKGR